MLATIRAWALAGALVACGPAIAQAQFFIGSPSGGFGTSSGTITNTPTFTANQSLQEIDVNGQLIIQNAAPPVQTATFSVTCFLDPTYNSGTPLPMALQISQSGFVTVPAGGQILDWTLQAEIVDNSGTAQPGSTTIALWPNNPTPYGPGTTTYGPTTTTGGTFTYFPATASVLTLRFTSNFDGLSGLNTYLWDFPVSVAVVPVPEPATWSMLGMGLIALAAARRLRKKV